MQAGAEELDALPSPIVPDPARAAEASEWRAALHHQIAALPDKYRLVITLFYLQGLSYREMASVLDLPLGTVKTHLYRAREQLKRQLEGAMAQE